MTTTSPKGRTEHLAVGTTAWWGAPDCPDFAQREFLREKFNPEKRKVKLLEIINTSSEAHG